MQYGDPRADAAALYPGYPAGENCAFSGEISVGDLPDGMHDLTIRISASDGAQSELATTFEVDNHAFETGRVIGRLDVPVRGAIFISREWVVVSGWALAPSGISSVDAFVDGDPRGRIDYGSLRPDIAKRRRQYEDADHCGFNGSVPMRDLTDGSHDLILIVTANDGQELELATRIEIDGSTSIDGGLPVVNRHYRTWLERRAAKTKSAVPLATTRSTKPLHYHVIVPLQGDCERELNGIVDTMFAQKHRRWHLTLVDWGQVSDGDAPARSPDRSARRAHHVPGALRLRSRGQLE